MTYSVLYLDVFGFSSSLIRGDRKNIYLKMSSWDELKVFKVDENSLSRIALFLYFASYHLLLS